MDDEMFLVLYRIGSREWDSVIRRGAAELAGFVARMDTKKWEIRVLPLAEVLALPRWKRVKRAEVELEDVEDRDA